MITILKMDKLRHENYKKEKAAKVLMAIFLIAEAIKSVSNNMIDMTKKRVETLQFVGFNPLLFVEQFLSKFDLMIFEDCGWNGSFDGVLLADGKGDLLIEAGKVFRDLESCYQTAVIRVGIKRVRFYENMLVILEEDSNNTEFKTYTFSGIGDISNSITKFYMDELTEDEMYRLEQLGTDKEIRDYKKAVEYKLSMFLAKMRCEQRELLGTNVIEVLEDEEEDGFVVMEKDECKKMKEDVIKSIKKTLESNDNLFSVATTIKEKCKCIPKDYSSKIQRAIEHIDAFLLDNQSRLFTHTEGLFF